MRRRALLAAAVAIPAAARAAAPLRERLGTLHLGANLERWFAVASNNQPRRLGPEWWRSFRAAGFDHARLFLPPPRESGTGEEVPALFAQAVQDANDAGLPVLLGLTDSLHHSNPWPEAEWRAVAARAAFFARRLSPAQVVLAPLNEPAFPDAPTWMPVRDRLLAMVRQAAPQHTLMWGGHEWCSWRSLLPATPPQDPDTVAEVHDYQGGDAAAVRWRFGQVAEWRQRHRLPVLVGELGGSEPHREDPQALAQDLRASLPVLRELRMPAALWAFTHGGWWRLQDNEAPQPRPALRGALG